LSSPRHILVFRFSALGDVAMTVPVLKNVLQQHPELVITFVSHPFMQPLVQGIDRLHFYPADTKKDFKGLGGLYTLSRKLKKNIPFDAVADLHDVLRTKLLRFFLGSRSTAVIDKGRKEKKELTRPQHKKLRPLHTTFQRYADVFEKLGIAVQMDISSGIVHRMADTSLLPEKRKTGLLIGVAPFAKHAAKMYPLEKMKETVRLLNVHSSVTILLFGSAAEASLLQEWEREMPRVYSLAGKTNFDSELNIISQLDVMISMDSANMHLASMYGVPVVSIWGGTHPFLGFYGWGQSMENAVQLDLPCRPSSVFGNKDCPVHGKEGCMSGITAEMIYSRVKEITMLR
jgi:ADP-heptose:LPS heptosyltransferase